MRPVLRLVIFPILVLVSTSALPNKGKHDFRLSKDENKLIFPKSLFECSRIIARVACESAKDVTIPTTWYLIESLCWDIRPILSVEDFATLATTRNNKTMVISQTQPILCSKGETHVDISPYKYKGPKNCPESKDGKVPVYTLNVSGIFIFSLQMNSNEDFNATVSVEMKSTHGYLSATDWPLLPFYGLMCLVYMLFGLIWLLLSFLQWRDLLRIQFWIGGVILLGMLEKATFYAEYQTINSTGTSVNGVILLAEWVSCGKRTLARMLVIIVSLGFGIVKPRLGPMLHRVVGTGLLYFLLAATESYLRVMHQKNDHNREILLASIPLAALDSAICWWIFTSLVQTTRTLKLRRNLVKLQLYRHFTNTLIIAVIASVVFMMYSLKAHKLAKCLADWKDLWIDEAYWHILFSSILLVIMILWRPTNNNQRYAFMPLLDPEDEEDEDEDEQFVQDAYGVKVRFHNRTNSPKPPKSTTTAEEDLRWVEDNIPPAIADFSLPIFDSDEEIMNTRFEVSKMQ